MIPQKIVLICFVLTAISLLPGCALIQTQANKKDKEHHLHKVHRKHKHKKFTDPIQEQQITVGGYVLKPGKQKLDHQQLSLRDAINIAGGLRTSANRSFSIPQTSTKNLAELKYKLATLVRLINNFQSAFDTLRTTSEESLVKSKLNYQKAKDAIGNQVSSIEQFSQEMKLNQSDPILADIVQNADHFWGSISMDLSTFKQNQSIELADKLESKLVEFRELLDESFERMNLLSSDYLVVSSANESNNQYLVSIRRDATMPRVTYYFPYEDVMGGGIAGGIPLKNGDMISLVTWKETSLNQSHSGGQQNSIIGNLSSQVAANELTKRFAHDQLTTVLIRESGDLRGKDVYLIPTSMTKAPGIQEGFHNLALLETDLVNVAPTLTAPLIADSVIGSIVADIIEEKTEITRPDFTRSQSTFSTLQRMRQSTVRNVATGFNRLIGF